MIVYFSETETAEEEYFRSELPEHELHFVKTLDEVDASAEIVSLFINVHVGADFLASHPHLRLIATRSRATDHLDLEACRQRQVQVSKVPSDGESTVAEHTFALLLAISRRLREVMQHSKAPFSYARTRAFDLCGKTLGIIGMGRIGLRVAALARAFQMEVIAHDVQASAEAVRETGFTFVPLGEIFARSEIISLHIPLTPENYHLLNAQTLAQCRPGVIIINTARGRLIDTAALRDALESGQVGGAGLDVLEDERVLREPAAKIIAGHIVENLHTGTVVSEAHDGDRLRELQELMLGDALLARPNVVFTPHVAFNSLEAVQRLAEGTVRNIQAFAAGAPINLA